MFGIQVATLATLFLCSIKATTSNVVCNNLEDCQTSFDTCIHQIGTSVKDKHIQLAHRYLKHFKSCVDARNNCNLTCIHRLRRDATVVALETSFTMFTKMKLKHKCIEECKKHFKGCGKGAIGEQFVCLRNSRGECQQNCAVKSKMSKFRTHSPKHKNSIFPN